MERRRRRKGKAGGWQDRRGSEGKGPWPRLQLCPWSTKTVLSGPKLESRVVTSGLEAAFLQS